MSIGATIAQTENLDDLIALRDLVKRLVHERMETIVRWKFENGLEIGVMLEITQRRGKTRKRMIPANGKITEMKKDTVTINVIAPMKYASKVLRGPFDMVMEPFTLSEHKEEEEDPTPDLTF